MQVRAIGLVTALVCFAPAPAQAQTSAEVAEIRRQIDQMKRDYESRIEALEKRLAETEGRTQAATRQGGSPGPDTASARQSGTAQRGNAFNPDISLILQGRYARLSQDPNAYRIDGFVPSGGEVDPGRRGLSLAESELVISANVDPYFSGTLVTALAPDGGAEVENAYLQTLGLSHGLGLKAGRFFSKIGYQNEQHSHAWDFIDLPLPYRAFLGGQLGDDGIQLKWVAPTELFVELGAEAGRGRGFPASDRNKNGSALGTLFAHIGGDLGASHSWRAGLSYLRTSPRERGYDDIDSTGTAVSNAFTGRSRLWIADFVWKWAPNGNFRERNFKLQAEYFQRREDGMLAFDTAGATPAAGMTDRYASRQSGWYAQAVYQFIPGWRAGLRYDRLEGGTTSLALVDSGALSTADFPLLAARSATLKAAMLDWSPSEFSRVRLQFALDHSRLGATDRQIFLQYILSLGAHGAHGW